MPFLFYAMQEFKTFLKIYAIVGCIFTSKFGDYSLGAFLISLLVQLIGLIIIVHDRITLDS